MFDVSRSEIFLYSGLAAMAAAVVLAILCIILFTVTGRRIRQKLERDYGKNPK